MASTTIVQAEKGGAAAAVPPATTQEATTRSSSITKEDLAISQHEDASLEHASPEDPAFRKAELKVVTKLDLYVCPILIFNTAVSIFYPLYILAEFPAALIVKRLGFNRVIPTAALCWGIVCLGNGFVQNFSGLAACRVLLGGFEGFLFPSLTLMLANYYKRDEIGLRISYLFIAAAMASAFGGLIASGILYMDGVAGYPGWRWLYIIEGAATIAIALACYFAIPSSYTTAWFLTDADKAIMRRRTEITEAYSGGDGVYTKADLAMAIRDPKTYLHGVVQIMCLTVLYGFSVFLPIILRFGFGMTVKESQYLSIPVFFWGSAVYGVVAWGSDRMGRRFLACVAMVPLGVVGYAILLGGGDGRIAVGVKYFACFLIASCAWALGGGNLSWLSTNTAPDGKRAASIGLALSMGNIGGIVSGQIYPQTMAPNYYLGHAWSLGAVCISLVLWQVLRQLYYRREAGKEVLRQDGSAEATVDRSDCGVGYVYQH
ncbi:putative transporter [Cyphellophora attinorum]|uniref:Putative transporter n=1 Tax=Cyphellophora attinorum TaxID=1664694 RepID=A0A0N1NXM4_9EURO|nr:putative transporter [Phialophora attinorum]KPI37594.1 putative transporter [Phialophora attinorum]